MAFLTLSPNQLDASTIPQLRQGFSSDDFSDAIAVAQYAEQAQKYARLKRCYDSIV
jgi:hypothetical protein